MNDFIIEDLEFDLEDNELKINMENKYYFAKAIKEEDPLRAIEEFKQVILLETTKGNWGFRSLKQIMKLLFNLGYKYDMIRYYTELLTYRKSAVTKNYSEKSIYNILDYISLDNDVEFMEEICSITLNSLEEMENERLWLKTNLKLAKLWLDKKEYIRLNKILSKLYDICENYNGSVDQLKEVCLLELYSLEIQMYSETKNNKRLKDLYHKTLKIKSANIYPYIMGVIRECGGKMHMDEKRWGEALTDFLESFKNYDEVDSPHKIRVLKYSILANMLNGSNINLFNSQEMKPYKSDPQFLAMVDLMNACQKGDIQKIELILKKHHDEIMEDAFIQVYIDDILQNIRSQILVRLILPYTQINISFIEKELNVTSTEVEALLINLILDERIQGKIDQVNQILNLKAEEELEEKKDVAILALAESVNKLWRLCLNYRY
ncbi:unnamed protein product [Pneumocystis jirovecii]|uniref:COP9 signalosome complex subunit 2 n=2 Tax=Pneumocystis jirovecii TaxID=42068 RepID=L0P7S7_PNEJI|nr:uncharacterized protein T551_01406 [Pneumocystis jirovecii RU7]KTW31334.1 hypothetical protein T551_01406 [Pneumocystis jirovecii RU7]CCJ28413.1 unnamed protein product [Pneumocystis jirovecii]